LGSAVGGAIVDRAGVETDFMLGAGLAVLGLLTLQRVTALGRSGMARAAKGPCEPSLD
jgi:hypothetical protein